MRLWFLLTVALGVLASPAVAQEKPKVDPELARHCDRGIPLTQLSKSPVGLALEQVAQQLLHHLESTSASATVSAELRGNEEHTL